MNLESKFYTACMNYHTDPGYAAYGVQQAGHFVEGLGPTLEWAGYPLTTYGLLHGLFSTLKIGRNVLHPAANQMDRFEKVVRSTHLHTLRRSEISDVVIDRLWEVGFGLG
jgi:hypothetical protein